MTPDRIVRMAAHTLRQWRERGFGPWAAIERRSGRWIGRIRLDELEGWPGPDRIEVGFELHQTNPDVPVVWYAIDRAAWPRAGHYLRGN